MADYTVKRGDTRPAFRFTLDDISGTTEEPVDLDGTEVITLFLTKVGGPTITKVCVLDQPSTASLHVDWVDGDTDVPGDYTGEVEIVYADGGRQTVPNDSTFAFHIKQDLGDS